MTKTFRVQHIGQAIGIATITTNGLIKEVHWIILQNQIIQQVDMTQILISSSSHYNWNYPSEISDSTIIQNILHLTIPNYSINGQTNYNWPEI
jgi:hypothetical protein